MAFRNIVVESPAHIGVKDRQLVIRTDGEHRISPEDISALLIENQRSTITTAALSLLGQRGCAVYVCDERHLPCAVLTPCFQHSRVLAAAERQMAIGEVLKKHLWRSVVSAKIRNQARCLRLCGIDSEAEGLEAMASSVRSGDGGNLEAAAAMRYFPVLFGAGRQLSVRTAQHILKKAGPETIVRTGFFAAVIIPYQELPGNYNSVAMGAQKLRIIPYQELPGNYNTIERTELQPYIIPYQELPGNYNLLHGRPLRQSIIPYQELPGNYNTYAGSIIGGAIIPYQELPGNYNL